MLPKLTRGGQFVEIIDILIADEATMNKATQQNLVLSNTQQTFTLKNSAGKQQHFAIALTRYGRMNNSDYLIDLVKHIHSEARQQILRKHGFSMTK
ncbi:hypothetical protein QDY71_08335 [Kingella negevensis]|uniref:Uncharacterized protein n=1 Tax=Kingella negevensis TaxID=1522312 RepID=A0A238TA51_9NEIS|nr:hypothetical protein [Kingella negevensis]MDK4683719.1 hypothetical protein [Kingella negevensis]MDK4697753.1 hypothetical protein [Kingella negevensis]MDK4708385.1 hypothetical protein [Kingella negevensis]MDK4710953.1 hypothetical protein [Kingella negevensis]SNB67337.1 Uncharacterised protein [Kingella negevensis]